MSPFKLIRKLLKALRGGAARREVFLGVMLGFAAGLTPGFNLTTLAFLLPLLFLNVNGAAGGLALVLGKIVMLAGAVVLYHVGYFLIHTLALASLVKALADTPVLALLDWHVYSVLAAFVLGPVIGAILGLWVSAALQKTQKAMAELGAGESAGRVGAFGRWLMRFMAGAKAETPPTSALFRKGRCIAAAVVALAIFLFSWLMLDSLAASALASGIGAINGAETNVAGVDLSLGSGRMVITGLQVTDPKKPATDSVRADEIVLDYSVADLLRRRLSVDELVCDRVRLGAMRDAPGEVYDKAKAQGADDDEPLADVAAESLGSDIEKGIEYARQVKRVNDKLDRLRDYLDKRAEEKRRMRQADPEQYRREILEKQGYLAADARELLADSPAWLIRKVKADNVILTEELPPFVIEGGNISSDPDLVEEAMYLKALPANDAMSDLKTGAGKLLGTAEEKLGDAADDAADKVGDKIKGLFNKD